MKKVLIIDDDPELVGSIRQILETNSYEVISANSGKEGIVKAKAENPDLIIIDVMMETWSEGFNVVDELRKNEKICNVPRILLTGLGIQSPLESISMSPEMMGVKFILQKPLKPADLLEYVRKALGE